MQAFNSTVSTTTKMHPEKWACWVWRTQKKNNWAQ